jgi:hypothetical protein
MEMTELMKLLSAYTVAVLWKEKKDIMQKETELQGCNVTISSAWTWLF